MPSQCETCVNLVRDPQTDEDYCTADLDEDDMAGALAGPGSQSCPFYEPGDEYRIVRHQN